MPSTIAGFKKKINRRVLAFVLAVALVAANNSIALAEPPPPPNPPTQPIALLAPLAAAAPAPPALPTPQAIPKDGTPPMTKVTDPIAGGVITGSDKVIKGIALDDVAIGRIEVSIQRADGVYWNGGGWTPSVVWLPAQIISGAGSTQATWSYLWKIIWSDGIGYKIKARGIDADGNTEGSTGFFVTVDNVAPIGIIDINSGELSTKDPAVTVTNSITGASRMHFSVDGGSTWSAWEDFKPAKTLMLTHGSGNKQVQAEFSDGINIYRAGATIDLEEVKISKQPELALPQDWSFLPTPKPGEIRAGENGKLYSFNAKQGRYEEIKAPSIGIGYWVYYLDPVAMTMVFKKLDEFDIGIKSGWNMVGNPFDRDVILPKGFVAYLFSPKTGNYWVADTIPEGGGAWVKADKDQTLTLYKKI